MSESRTRFIGVDLSPEGDREVWIQGRRESDGALLIERCFTVFKPAQTPRS